MTLTCEASVPLGKNAHGPFLRASHAEAPLGLFAAQPADSAAIAAAGVSHLDRHDGPANAENSPCRRRRLVFVVGVRVALAFSTPAGTSDDED